MNADAKGDGEIQKQEVVIREELHTPLPQRGQFVEFSVLRIWAEIGEELST